MRCGKATKASFGHGDHAGAMQLSRMMAYRPRSVQGLQLYCTLVHFKLVPHGKKEEKKREKKRKKEKRKEKRLRDVVLALPVSPAKSDEKKRC